MTRVPRSRIEVHRCRGRFIQSFGSPRKSPKVLKPLLSGIPIEVSDDLNAYLDNISNRKALKRFSDKAVNAWFRSRGYEKK